MDLINENNMFLHKLELIGLYNLICTFKDRIITIVDYLNSHDKKPETEEDFINYFVYASMLYDGFNKMHENLMHQIPKYREKNNILKIKSIIIDFILLMKLVLLMMCSLNI